MLDTKIFEAALAIHSPWYIKDVQFDVTAKKLDIFIDFKRGTTFPSTKADCPEQYKVKDTFDKAWRHLNFFEHECYLHCRTPRIDLGGNKTELISPPWAGVNSGFTLLFEALVIELCAHMPIHSVCQIINESDNKIWRLLEKYVDRALESEDYSHITAVGMDETSRTKGHNYITLFVDMLKGKTVHVAEGKDHKTVSDFVDVLESHNGDRNQIKDASCDMSPAFIKGVNIFLPEAKITFDKFHIVKIINHAVDQVRREEVATQPILTKARYVLLKNEKNLTKKQREKLEELQLSKINLKSIRALHIRENFQEIYKAPTEEDFEDLLKKWYFWATHSRLEPIIKAAKTIKNHWDGVLEWKKSQISNGILEGLNSIVQAAKAKARGFKTFRNFRIVVFLLTGDLDFKPLNPYVAIK
ncbi:MAG: ISL3 family transposase [Desulfobacterales bacterium]|nr:ISL3 family transposase [Desulfobacterales bacterium]